MREAHVKLTLRDPPSAFWRAARRNLTSAVVKWVLPASVALEVVPFLSDMVVAGDVDGCVLVWYACCGWRLGWTR